MKNGNYNDHNLHYVSDHYNFRFIFTLEISVFNIPNANWF